MKAVLITDSFQVIIMFTGLIAILIKGSIEVGGFGEAWQLAYDSGRVYFDELVSRCLSIFLFLFSLN